MFVAMVGQYLNTTIVILKHLPQDYREELEKNLNTTIVILKQ